MKVFKVEVMVIDFDELGEAEVKSTIETTRYPNYCINPSVKKIETREVEWSDDHPLNKRDTTDKAYAELFGSGPASPASLMDRNRMGGWCLTAIQCPKCTNPFAVDIGVMDIFCEKEDVSCPYCSAKIKMPDSNNDNILVDGYIVWGRGMK